MTDRVSWIMYFNSTLLSAMNNAAESGKTQFSVICTDVDDDVLKKAWNYLQSYKYNVSKVTSEGVSKLHVKWKFDTVLLDKISQL